MTPDEPALERLRIALDALAEGDARALVTEAHVEARARVRGMLVEAIAERLLERAEGELAEVATQPADSPARPAPHEDAAPARRADAESRSSRPRARPAVADGPAAPRADERAAKAGGRGPRGWYVYGIVEEDFEPPALSGVDGVHELELVRGAGLGALASRVPLDEYGEDMLQTRLEDVSWLEHIARRHERILESVRELRATVVPMRLFTLYESAQSIVDMLARERDYLADALARLSCRAEWGVKLYARADTEDDGDAGIVEGEDDPGEPSGGPGSSYMLRRRTAARDAEAAASRIDAFRDRVHERLREVAVDARVNPLQPPELDDHDGTMLMNGVYLVDDDALGRFEDVVSEARRDCAEDGVDVVLTGPWPPYNFVNGSAEADR